MIAASLLHGLRSDRRIAAVMLPFCLLAISCDDGSVQSPPCTGESCRGDASPDADATALTDAPLGPEAEASVGVEAGEAATDSGDAATDAAASGPWSHGALGVDVTGRHFVYADGTPFFWMGDTAWELIHRLGRDDVVTYLDSRAARGFNVIQAVALGELSGVTEPNAHGDVPFWNTDATQPATTSGSDPGSADEYDFWDHLDFIVTEAHVRGLYLGLLPTWGDKVNFDTGAGPNLFDEASARAYGEFLGARYAGRPNVIWILGGDRNADGVEGVWREMAKGIRDGAGGSPMMTFHPVGWRCSSDWFHNDDWLTFDMCQSGHGAKDVPLWNIIEGALGTSPPKPVIDGEPTYEDHPIAWNPDNGYFRDHDARKQTWRAVLSGSPGVTYGHHSIWQMYDDGHAGVSSPDRTWREALDRPGGSQMIHLRRLFESRPMLTRIPDQGLLAGDEGQGGSHRRAARSSDGSYAIVYVPTAGTTFPVDLSLLSGATVRGWWYDPRTGTVSDAGEFVPSGTVSFTSPGDGPDWVLVIDDTSRGFDVPGKS